MLYMIQSSNGVIISLRVPHSSITVFSSGKTISVGSHSESSALLSCRIIARLIQRIRGYEEVEMKDFKIHNVTASGALGYRIDLNQLARHSLHRQRVDYDPDRFPGLHYKVPLSEFDQQYKKEEEREEDPSSSSLSSSPSSSLTVTATLFWSGRLTLVGSRSERCVYSCYNHLSKILFSFAQLSLFPQDVPIQYEDWIKWAVNNEQIVNSAVIQPWMIEELTVKQLLNKREQRQEKEKNKKKMKIEKSIGINTEIVALEGGEEDSHVQWE